MDYINGLFLYLIYFILIYNVGDFIPSPKTGAAAPRPRWVHCDHLPLIFLIFILYYKDY